MKNRPRRHRPDCSLARLPGSVFSGSILQVFHLDPFHAQWFISHPTPTSIRYFVPTGLIYMTILYLVVFAIEAAMKRLRTAGLWTTIVYVLALAIGFAAKFGFTGHELY